MLSYYDDFDSQQDLIDLCISSRVRDGTTQTIPPSYTRSNTLGETTHVPSLHTSRVHFEQPSMSTLYVDTNLPSYMDSRTDSRYFLPSPGPSGHVYGACAPSHYETPYHDFNDQGYRAGTFGRSTSEFNRPLPQYIPIPRPAANSPSRGRVKVLEPETFDGSTSGAEISEYLIHFEQVADWNQWDDSQKAKMLKFKLRGEAQKFVSTLTYLQVTNYATLK